MGKHRSGRKHISAGQRPAHDRGVKWSRPRPTSQCDRLVLHALTVGIATALILIGDTIAIAAIDSDHSLPDLARWLFICLVLACDTLALVAPVLRTGAVVCKEWQRLRRQLQPEHRRSGG